MVHFRQITPAVFVFLFGLVLSFDTPCSTRTKNGGICVSKKMACPTGSTEQTVYNNYIGCASIYMKCCAIDDIIPPTTTTESTTATTTVTMPAPKCGLGSLVSSKILNGINTGVCDWPFVVSIRSEVSMATTLDLDNTEHACQGVIVGKEWVLTSAVCILSAGFSETVAPDRILVVAADFNVSAIDYDPLTKLPQEQAIKVDKVFINPGYGYLNESELEADNFTNYVKMNSNGIALIKLAEPINGHCSGIVCLPTPNDAVNECAKYDQCVITGWGFTQDTLTEDLSGIMRFAPTTLSSKDACNFLTESLGISSFRPQGSICQRPNVFNTDSCLGDEGGAVMCVDGDQWTVRGIIPFNKCLKNQYNSYVTDVSNYLTWIHTIMQ